MKRAFPPVILFLLVSIETIGQCLDPATISLSSLSGNTCGTTSITVTGNTFGGSASSVTLTASGSGKINPASTAKQPFDFTYTPGTGDIGTIVLITITTNLPKDPACVAANVTYTLSVSAYPSAPLVGNIIQPTCTVSTGSIDLHGLPATGTWTIVRNPGGILTSGSGTTTTLSGLTSGTYIFTVTNSTGCTSIESAGAVINLQPPVPTAPIIGAISNPTCTISTGVVELAGLPPAGLWKITRTPGGVITTGSGSTLAISGLALGTYAFTVTSSTGCTSVASANVVINAQPTYPSAPTIGTITKPSCAIPTGNVLINGLPATGSWTLTRYPDNITSPGAGANITLTGIPVGQYNYSVTNSAGCVSQMSANVIIPSQPLTPSAPLIGAITQPNSGQQSGSVVLNGLPENGTWTLTSNPGNVTTSGSGVTKTISGLSVGNYSFTVTNSSGCTSVPSSSFAITSSNGAPELIITNPAPVCSPQTINLTAAGITAGSTPDLTFTYWINAGATVLYSTPSVASDGTYYIKGTTTDGLFTVKPVTVSVYHIPLANPGPDQILANVSEATLNALLAYKYEIGFWSLISGSGEILDNTNPKSTVSRLSKGTNTFSWTVSNGVCPSSSKDVTINVRDRVLQTLITPNMDGKNDYLILKGTDVSGKIELVIFDRRGAEVYKNNNYDNSWNGVDFNGRPLADDTYFYLAKTENSAPIKGYIVVRR
jgi:gliding motility-associated-like protein